MEPDLIGGEEDADTLGRYTCRSLRWRTGHSPGTAAGVLFWANARYCYLTYNAGLASTAAQWRCGRSMAASGGN